MMKDILSKLISKTDLSQLEAYDAMSKIMKGEATPSQIAGFLVALRAKGETSTEIAGCALAMRDSATSLALKHENVVDSCGTGGDGKASLNISTAAAFVAAGAGLVVAKHGNRSISSQCGSADVLEELGVQISCPIAVVEECINKGGIGFMFAPNFHPAMKYAMPTRRELGIRTVFNLLGPLTNPARAKVQLIGVFDKALLKPISQVLVKMKHKAGLVVHSHGWDEITLDGPTHVAEVFGGKIKNYTWTHQNFGLPKISSRHLSGSDAKSNAQVILSIFNGQKHPAKDIVLANAAALIWIAERAYAKKTISLKQAVERARTAIDSGDALSKCKQMSEISRMIE